MLVIELPEAEEKARSKSHRGGPVIPMLRRSDGSVVTGPRGHPLRDLPLPLHISNKVDFAYIEYKHYQIAHLKKSDIIDRMTNGLSGTAYTNRRMRYRTDAEKNGLNNKNYIVRNPTEKSNEKFAEPLMSLLRSLNQDNFDYNTVADVKNGQITLPRPKDLPMGEVWDPRPITVYRNGTPHQYRAYITEARRMLSISNTLGSQDVSGAIDEQGMDEDDNYGDAADGGFQGVGSHYPEERAMTYPTHTRSYETPFASFDTHAQAEVSTEAPPSSPRTSWCVQRALYEVLGEERARAIITPAPPRRQPSVVYDPNTHHSSSASLPGSFAYHEYSTERPRLRVMDRNVDFQPGDSKAVLAQILIDDDAAFERHIVSPQRPFDLEVFQEGILDSLLIPFEREIASPQRPSDLDDLHVGILSALLDLAPIGVIITRSQEF